MWPGLGKPFLSTCKTWPSFKTLKCDNFFPILQQKFTIYVAFHKYNYTFCIAYTSKEIDTIIWIGIFCIDKIALLRHSHMVYNSVYIATVFNCMLIYFWQLQLTGKESTLLKMPAIQLAINNLPETTITTSTYFWLEFWQVNMPLDTILTLNHHLKVIITRIYMIAVLMMYRIFEYLWYFMIHKHILNTSSLLNK